MWSPKCGSVLSQDLSRFCPSFLGPAVDPRLIDFDLVVIDVFFWPLQIHHTGAWSLVGVARTTLSMAQAGWRRRSDRLVEVDVDRSRQPRSRSQGAACGSPPLHALRWARRGRKTSCSRSLNAARRAWALGVAGHDCAARRARVVDVPRFLQGDVEISHIAERPACSPCGLEIAPQTGTANRACRRISRCPEAIHSGRKRFSTAPHPTRALISRFCSLKGPAPHRLATERQSQPSHPQGECG